MRNISQEEERTHRGRLAVVMGVDRPEHETYMQTPRSGLCLAVDLLRGAIDKSPSLHRELLKAAYALQTQVTQTALANGRSKIEERLARWLLMADDRIDGDELPLTHEFQSLMLGVQRSGVTLAAGHRGTVGVAAEAACSQSSIHIDFTWCPPRRDQSPDR